jgi:hypothetical protein
MNIEYPEPQGTYLEIALQTRVYIILVLFWLVFVEGSVFFGEMESEHVI